MCCADFLSRIFCSMQTFLPLTKERRGPKPSLIQWIAWDKNFPSSSQAHLVIVRPNPKILARHDPRLG